MTSIRFFGYKHWTLEETPRCFYVGKGTKNRPFSTRSRNHKWHAISLRLGKRVEICFGPVSNKEACEWEIENIENMKTFSSIHSHDEIFDIGCNFTLGGDGVTMTTEIRKKISDKAKIFSKGERNPMFGKKGKDNPNFGQRRKGSEQSCRTCQKKFWKKASKIKAGRGKYCSKQCYLDFHPNKFRVQK